MMNGRGKRPGNETAGGGAQLEQADDLTFEVTDLASGASQAHPLDQRPATEDPAEALQPKRSQPTTQHAPLLKVTRAPTRVILTLDARALRIGLAALTLLVVAGIVISNVPRLGRGWFAYAPLGTPTPHVVSQSRISFGVTVDPSQPTVIAATPTIPIQALGPVPTDCAPNGTGPSAGAPGLGTSVGRDPVLVDAFDGPTATLSIPAHGGNQFTQYGWQVTIELVFTNNYNGPVTLSGNSITTNYPLWFSSVDSLAETSNGSQAPTTAFTISSQEAQANGAGVSGNTVFYPIALYLPGAGCFTLAANWPDGRWQIGFAAGA